MYFIINSTDLTYVLQSVIKYKNSIIMDAKTPFCKHQNGCIYDTLKQTLKQVKYGLIISSILQLIKSLRSLSKGLAGMKKTLTPQYLSIIVFLSSSTFALRTVKCALRWIRNKDDGFNSFIAGMTAGFVGTLTLNKGYWYIMLMFVASRIIGAIYQALIQKKVLNSQNSQFHYYILFVIANMVHCYGYFIEADILRPDVYNLYERMSALTPNEMRWHRSSLKYCKRSLIEDKRQFYNDFLQQKIDKLSTKIDRLKE